MILPDPARRDVRPARVGDTIPRYERRPDRLIETTISRLLFDRRVGVDAAARRAVGAHAGRPRAARDGGDAEGRAGGRRPGVHRGRAAADAERRQPEPRAIRRAPPHPYRSGRRAAALFQPSRARDACGSHTASLPSERRTAAAAPVEPGRRRVLADRTPRASRTDTRGQFRRTDGDVSGTPAALQPDAQLRCHLHRRSRVETGARRRSGDRCRPVSRRPARHSMGMQGHHRRARISDAVGIGRVQRADHRHRGDRRPSAARSGCRARRQARDR